MIVLMQGESLLLPATVTGSKSQIENLTVELKRSTRGEVPPESAATVATLAVQDYTADEITNGYLFSLDNTASLSLGIYYVNYSYEIGNRIFKGTPLRVVVKESVV